MVAATSEPFKIKCGVEAYRMEGIREATVIPKIRDGQISGRNCHFALWIRKERVELSRFHLHSLLVNHGSSEQVLCSRNTRLARALRLIRVTCSTFIIPSCLGTCSFEPNWQSLDLLLKSTISVSASSFKSAV